MPDQWRTAGQAVIVRRASLSDYPGIRALESVLGDPAPWTIQQLESHLIAFHEGQLVVEEAGEVVAAAASFIVRWDEYVVNHAWKAVTGDGFFTTHDETGRTLYCAEWSFNLARCGEAVVRALFQAQRRLCRRLNLRRIIAAVPLPGYRAVMQSMTPELYVKRAIWGDIAEPNVRLPLSQGFQYCGIIRDYRPEDEDSCGHAALVVWLNPLYAPAAPPANIDRERRKCA